MQKIHIVLSCTSRKRTRRVDFPRLRSVRGEVEDRAAAWSHLVDRTAPEAPATDLYCGEYWCAGLELVDTARTRFQVDIWILSAGLGLVRGETPIAPYSATLTDGHLDSVVPSGSPTGAASTKRRWWAALSAWVGPSRCDQPRTLEQLAISEKKSHVIVVAGSNYIDAVSVDLLRARKMLSASNQLMVFAAGPPRPGLEDNWVSVPGKLRTALGGSMSSTGPRAARAAIEALHPSEVPRPDQARLVVTQLADRAPPLPESKRKRLDDHEITHWIAAAVTEQRAVAKTSALRALRDEGLACEQARFGRLFDRVIGQPQ